MKKLRLYKSTIAVILGAIVSYLAVKGILGEAEVTLIGAVMVAVFGAGSYITSKNYEKKPLSTK